MDPSFYNAAGLQSHASDNMGSESLVLFDHTWKPLLAAINGYAMAGALELVLTARAITAQWAYVIGFLNKVVPKEQLMDEAKELARQTIDNAPLWTRSFLTSLMRMSCPCYRSRSTKAKYRI